ncbi:hypothetical protein AHAS_Ahas17G0159100 [Arachis hypogaea]
MGSKLVVDEEYLTVFRQVHGIVTRDEEEGQYDLHFLAVEIKKVPQFPRSLIRLPTSRRRAKGTPRNETLMRRLLKMMSLVLTSAPGNS